MNDLISRDALSFMFDDVGADVCADYVDSAVWGFSYNVVHDIISKVPTVDAVPVVHGRWVMPTVIGGRAFEIPHCSACDGIPAGVDEHTKYCPNCGAKMDLEDEA